MAVFTTICGDTWMGVYKDGDLVYQDHNISYDDLLKLVEHEKVEYFGKYECSLEWLDEEGRLPNCLRNVKIAHWGKNLPFYTYLEVINA